MPRKIKTVLKASYQLSLEQLLQYAIYRAGLYSGLWKLRTPTNSKSIPIDNSCNQKNSFHLSPPTNHQLEQILGNKTHQAIEEADLICEGKFKQFGDTPVPLELCPNKPLLHWTAYEKGTAKWGCEDVKFIWEPARFGWVFTLGRAYTLTQNEKYFHSFWQNLSTFIQCNPINIGPNWTSGQEVALRIIALLFAQIVFSNACNQEQAQILTKTITDHAERIPPTLCYAKAQNNNHLIVEAAGLYSAGLACPNHPSAKKWQKLGWKWFHIALRKQIQPDGTYIQQSTNYHRVMLQAALWVYSISTKANQTFPKKSLTLLKAATHWLLAHLDAISGQVPNLGHNDGANILPLSQNAYCDFRPVAQAASIAFLKQPYLPEDGNWNELCCWLNIYSTKPDNFVTSEKNLINRLGNKESWAILRAEHFSNRPAHADQLHVDLWYQGYNIALDPGTYLYNANPPWRNPFTKTSVHNTISVNKQDQMEQAGRFLWLDWAQAKRIESENKENSLIAEHYGYKKHGLIHKRKILFNSTKNWVVTDYLLPLNKYAKLQNQNLYTLHWLLPDWPWEIKESNAAIELFLQAPWEGSLNLNISFKKESLESSDKLSATIHRAGLRLYGNSPENEIMGWISPTYGKKIPAISCQVDIYSALPLSITSNWIINDPNSN